MINNSNKKKLLSLLLAASAFLLASGNSARVSAQRDPFARPVTATKSSGGNTTASTVKAEKPKPPVPVPVAAPSIQDRIDYYKRIREAAAISNQPIPKVTSVLTLEEMSVVGIFRTPRGYAAMVEAKPIKLSYTIYPGEKFFDGQLVAIEENRLVFRKITKMSDGKFIAAEENKALRQYSVEQEVQGTAPVEAASGKTETAANTAPANSDGAEKPKANVPAVVSSPLEEMMKQAAEDTPKDSAKAKPTDKNKKQGASSDKKASGKSEKVAKNKD